MVKTRVLDPIPALDESQLSQALRDEGIKEVHARAVWRYALAVGREHGSEANFDQFKDAEFQLDAPANLGPLLRRKFAVLTSRVVEQQLSEDGTTKLLVRLQDGQMVETVIISHGGKHPRTTLCVSSQVWIATWTFQALELDSMLTSDITKVGCQMGCTFCATGTMGLKGDLMAGEILEQVLHASRVSPIRNVVFMGMGEPLNNYDAVLAAIRGMSDGRMFKLSPRHITLSTVGVVPRIKQLTQDAPETQLALSLHAPNQELRNRIVPSARAYRLDKLIDALDGHLRGPRISSSSQGSPVLRSNPVIGDTNDSSYIKEGSAGALEDRGESIAGVLVGGKGAGRRALIEYVMLAGVNDSEKCARELGELLKGRNVVVNLIPYNPTYAPGSEEFAEPTEEVLQTFKSIVHEHGLLVTIRRHHGRDISGACGQLAIKAVAKHGAGGSSGGACNAGNDAEEMASDIEDLVSKSNDRIGKARARNYSASKHQLSRSRISGSSRSSRETLERVVEDTRGDIPSEKEREWTWRMGIICMTVGMGALVLWRTSLGRMGR